MSLRGQICEVDDRKSLRNVSAQIVLLERFAHVVGHTLMLSALSLMARLTTVLMQMMDSL